MPTLSTTNQNDLSATAERTQTYPDAVALSGGGWAVAYLNEVSPSSYQLLLQRFSADGAAQGEAVNLGGAQGAPQVAQLADGGFVVGWTSAGANNTADVYAQRFGADGHSDGRFMLNNGEARDQRLLELVERDGGGFVALWSQPQQDAPTSSPGHNPFGAAPTFVLTAQVYDAAGAKVGGYQSLSAPVATIGDFEARPLAGGGFLIVQEVFAADHYQLQGQAYDAAARPVGGKLALSADGADPQLAVLTDGSFVVASRQSAGGDADIGVQHFTAGGQEIDHHTLLSTDSLAQVTPDIAALADGGYLVSYYSQVDGPQAPGAPEAYQLYAQRFDAADQPVDAEIRLSSETASTFAPAHLAVGADGTTLAVWTARPAAGENDVVGRLIAPSTDTAAFAGLDHLTDLMDLRPLFRDASPPQWAAVADDALHALGALATEIQTRLDDVALHSADWSFAFAGFERLAADHVAGGDWLI